MASTRTIELETGTWTGRVRRHNGYWAGDFWGSDEEVTTVVDQAVDSPHAVPVR